MRQQYRLRHGVPAANAVVGSFPDVHMCMPCNSYELLAKLSVTVDCLRDESGRANHTCTYI